MNDGLRVVSLMCHSKYSKIHLVWRQPSEEQGTRWSGVARCADRLLLRSATGRAGVSNRPVRHIAAFRLIRRRPIYQMAFC